MGTINNSSAAMAVGNGAAPPPVVSPGDLATQFYLLSQALDDFRMDHWDDLSPGQRGQLKDEAQALDTRAHYLTADFLGQLAQGIQGDLRAIKAVTVDAESALNRLKKVDSVISIATAAVALAAAIATANIGSITSATTALTDSISAAVN
jgi:hypothetical protein